MANGIIPLQPSADFIVGGNIFFVKVNYFYVPFFNPSRDTILSAQQASDEIVITILDVQFDSSNNATCKCELSASQDTMTVANAEQYIMNIFNYISSNVTRLWGLNISQCFYTTDDSFPSDGSTIVASGTDKVNPSNSDLGNQVDNTVDNVKNAANSAVDNVKKSVGTTGIYIAVGAVVLLLLLMQLARVERGGE